MATIRNIFVLPILTVVLIYAGIKIYLYYEIKGRVDQAINMSAPFVNIEYDGISTTMEGAVYLEKVKLRLKNINEEIRVDKLGFITPGLVFLLGHANNFIEQKKFPEKMGISVQGVHISLTGELIDTLTKSFPEQSEKKADSGLACTLSGSYPGEQLMELGIYRLIFDLTAKVNYDQENSTLKFNINSAIHGVEETDVTFTVENIASDISGILSNQATSTINSFTVNYRPDRDLTNKINQYCANLKGITVQEYIDQLVNQSDEAYLADLGFIPGPGIRAALKQLLMEAGEISLTTQAIDSNELGNLHLYKAEDIPHILGLSVSLNDKEINDLSFSMGTAPKVSSSDIPTIWEQTEPDEQTVTIKKITTQGQQNTGIKARKFHAVERMQLIDKIGRKARIKTKKGITKTGKITQVKDKQVTLKARMYGGDITFNIPLAEITYSEVRE